MRGGNVRHPVGADFHVLAQNKAISTHYFAAVGIPHYQLAAGHLHRVIFIDVAVFACASTSCAKRYLAKSSQFTHGVWRIEGIYHIYFVASFIGGAQKSFFGEFLFYQIDAYLRNYCFHLMILNIL